MREGDESRCQGVASPSSTSDERRRRLSCHSSFHFPYTKSEDVRAYE